MPRGSFRSETNALTFEPARLIEGTDEQQAIWHALLNTDTHVVVEAVAGSGKTFAITQYAMREREARVGLVAFNKHIATELTSRMGGQANVECMTYHSLGFRCIRQNIKRAALRVDQYKVLGILDKMHFACEKKKQKVVKYRVSSMVSYAKTYGYGAGVTRDELEAIADRHDVDLEGEGELVLSMVPRVLAKCAGELATVDFDDMVWLPYILDLKPSRYDVLCVDEYQDTATTQQWLAVQAGKRVCAVGDKHQAIYSFRGCDGTGFDKLRRELAPNVVTLPLTLTRRCPKSHVRLAQVLVPQIRAMDDAPEGVVRELSGVDAAVKEMRVGDLVVCRVNAELVGVAYKLLKRGVKAVVRGRDIGTGIKKLLDSAIALCGPNEEAIGVPRLSEVVAHAGEITQEQVIKFLAMPHGRGEARAANTQDRYECLVELTQDCKGLLELRTVLDKLFAEFEEDGKPKDAVVLGTVHRTKGLEGARVYVLRPDLIPHPMARKAEDQAAEMNLLYVAVTRAKYDAEKAHVGELVFVGAMPEAIASGCAGGISMPVDACEAVGEGLGSIEVGKARGGHPDEADEDSGPSSIWDERQFGWIR